MESALQTLRGWVEAAHPFPLAAVLCLTALIGLSSSPDSSFDTSKFFLVLAGMLFAQLAIGWTNDFADRESDRRFRPSKPVSAGRVNASLMPPAIMLAVVLALIVGLLLGTWPLLLLIAGTAAGLSYDLWFKETRWSWAPFLVAFAVLPLYVWSSLDLFRTELLAVYAVGISLVPAVHVANVLPDMEADVVAQRRNVAVIFGRDKALRVIAVCLNLPLLLVVLSVPFIDYHTQVLSLVLLGYMATLLVGAFLYWRGEDALGFKAVVVASVLFAGGWLTAV